MSINFTAFRLTGGSQREHISHLWWRNPSSGATGDNSRADLVSWVERCGQTYVSNSGSTVAVGVVTPGYGLKYLRSYADGVWTNNLLAPSAPLAMDRGHRALKQAPVRWPWSTGL